MLWHGEQRVCSLPHLSQFCRHNHHTILGHEIVATIAQSHLDPDILNAVCSILGTDSFDGDSERLPDAAPCYLSSVATWADKIRFHARWSAPLHYVGGVGDFPPSNCLFPGPDGWEGKDLANVLDAINNVTTILTGGAQDQAQEALKFLIHFIGDMHQPLHLTGRDRGANGVKVSFDGKGTST